MKIGSVIKYLRTKSKITQNELARGICSIPHLSKIENNNKDANKETIELLLERLGVSLENINNKDYEIKKLLDQLIDNIHYHQKPDAMETFKKLETSNEFIPFTPYLYLYELYIMRYLIFIGNLDGAGVQKKWLNKHKKNFSQYETYLFNYYSALFLIMRGQYIEADEALENLLHEDNTNNEILQGEYFYHLSLVKGNLELSGQAIFYGIKALQFFKNQFNFKRILHTLMLLGINYTHSKLYQEANDCYRHLLRNVDILEDSNFKPQIFHNIGYLMDRMGNSNESILYYQTCLELLPEDSAHYLINHYTLGELNFRLGNVKEAMRYFNKTLELSGNHSNQKYSILSQYYLLELMGFYDEAAIFLEENLIPFLESIGEHQDELQNFKNHLIKYYKEQRIYEKSLK